MSTDPLYAATSRLNAEIAESTRLYYAGATGPAEYARQQEVLAQRLREVEAQHAIVNRGMSGVGATGQFAGYHTRVVKRGFAQRMSVRLAVPLADVDAIQRRLAGMRANTALWIADERFSSLAVRGFYKDFSLDLAAPPTSFCSLTIEGLAET